MTEYDSIATEVTEQRSVSGETRLWSAVIICALREYELWLRDIRTIWLARGEPVHKSYGTMLRDTQRELRHDWFRHICDLADVPHSTVMRKVVCLEREYGIINVTFADNGEELPLWKLQALHRGYHRV